MAAAHREFRDATELDGHVRQSQHAQLRAKLQPACRKERRTSAQPDVQSGHALAAHSQARQRLNQSARALRGFVAIVSKQVEPLQQRHCRGVNLWERQPAK